MVAAEFVVELLRSKGPVFHKGLPGIATAGLHYEGGWLE